MYLKKKKKQANKVNFLQIYDSVGKIMDKTFMYFLTMCVNV